MKIFTKKSVIFAVLAVALLATALVISCNVPAEVTSDDNVPSIPGTGKVRLSINPVNSRAIVPTAAPSGGYKYLLKLTGDGSSLPDFYAAVNTSTVSVSNVPYGTYESAQVFVYTGTTLISSTFTSYPNVAIGASVLDNNSNSGFDVGASSTPNLGTHSTALYLPGTAPTVGTGSFSYNIDDGVSGTGLASAKFVVKGRGIADFINAPKDVVFDGNTGSTESLIPSGSYDVIYTLDNGTNIAYFVEILHVYKGMESTFTRSITDDFFPVPIPGPGTGGGTIVIEAPDLPENPNFSITLSGGDSNVIVSTLLSAGSGWTVEVKQGAARTLTLTVGTPSSVTIGNWKKVNGTISTIIDATSDGLTVGPPNGQVIDFTFDTTNPSFPTSVLPIDGSYTYTYMELQYKGVQFNTPPIRIKFVP